MRWLRSASKPAWISWPLTKKSNESIGCSNAVKEMVYAGIKRQSRYRDRGSRRHGAGDLQPLSACKGGLIAFAKTMAREMVRKGVILNCVCPGPTDTPMLRAFLDESERGKRVYEALKGAIPMRRLGEPEDIPG